VTDILNLDELATGTEKVLKLKGKEHALKVLSVRDFIKNAKQSIELAKTDDAVVHLESLVELVKELFPSLTDEDLNDLSMNQLNAILEFARPKAERQADEAESKKGKAKAK
jgi:hypothetical protein